MANLLTQLSKKNRTDEFLEAIRTFDQRVVGLEPGIRGTTPTVLVDLNLPTKLPINVLGDGFCRISLMVTGLLGIGPRILAVDEIDAGLHASIMVAFWKNLVKLAGRMGKQIFCTTHNEEMLSHTIEAFADSKDALRIYRLDRIGEGQVQATKYTYETYSRSESLGLDIR
ncbi:MAG: AAA family ATPase [Planctomycetota bacterium]|nr:AAA family ATPase [Planctomycetota bacterium]